MSEVDDIDEYFLAAKSAEKQHMQTFKVSNCSSLSVLHLPTRVAVM